MLEILHQTVEFINKRTNNFDPEFGIVLGSGLGELINDIDIKHELLYSNIPNFPISTVEFHAGKLIFGILNGKKVVAMQGRFHLYEGYTMQQITFPIRVMKLLGVQKLFVSNACGSLNPEFKKGELMVIEDHINLQPDSPLRGANLDEFGVRFPDMSEPYKREYIQKALEIAANKNITMHKGVYVSVLGPNLETKAEYRYLRLIGGDAVGMSTVPEVIVANHCSIPVVAISVITDEGFHDDLKPVSFVEIVNAARIAEPNMTAVLKELISVI